MSSKSEFDVMQSYPDGFNYTTWFPTKFTRPAAVIPSYARNELQSLYHMKDFNSDSSLVLSAENVKMAGMKIFATIMLNAWRSRRYECRLLNHHVEKLKDLAMKARNQLHVYNALFRVEQQRNDDLTCQLKHSMNNIDESKSSCEGLTTSLISLKADHALLEEQLRVKNKEYENLNALLTQSKTELYETVEEQKELKRSLSKEQRTKQFMENQKNKLINEICELSEINSKAEAEYRKQLKEKDEKLLEAYEKEKKLLQEIDELKEKSLALTTKQAEEDFTLLKEVKMLRLHCIVLKHELDTSFGNQIKVYFAKFRRYQEMMLKLAHILTYCLLPAVPKPKLAVVGKLQWFKL